MNKAAIQTSSVTMTRVVTAEGNWKDRFAFGAGASCAVACVSMSPAAGGVRVLFAGAVVEVDRGSDPDDHQHGEHADQRQDGNDQEFHGGAAGPARSRRGRG